MTMHDNSPEPTPINRGHAAVLSACSIRAKADGTAACPYHVRDSAIEVRVMSRHGSVIYIRLQRLCL
jgi:hypothetical protein